MNKSSLLLYLSATLGLTAVSLTAALLPFSDWNIHLCLSLVILCITLLATAKVLTPNALPDDDSKEYLASLGPIVFIMGLVLIWASTSVIFAVSGYYKASNLMNIISTFSLVSGLIVIKLFKSGVSDVKSHRGARDLKSRWIIKLNQIHETVDNPKLKIEILSIVDLIRFSPSDFSGQDFESDKEVEEIITKLSQTTNPLDDIGQLKRAILRRQDTFKAARSVL